MTGQRTLLTVAGLVAVTMSPPLAVAGTPAMTSGQLVQSTMHAMSALHGLHSETNVHLIGPPAGGTGSEDIKAHVSLDCVITYAGSKGMAAIRASVQGTVVPAGAKASRPFNMRYILLASSGPNGSSQHLSLWERDVMAGTGWHSPHTSMQSPAYAAFVNAQEEGCPAGIAALHAIQGARSKAPVMTGTGGRRDWSVSGTSGNLVAGRFTIRLLIAPATYRLYRATLQLRQSVRNTPTIIRQDTTTVYSGYGERLTITAPKPGSRTP
ncbi:MAG TPA: hypothetical protein VFB58_11230 [Chloroflexota bacterium]|nr:hypothetical protein [Chloroflexota bacterium]